MKILSYIPGFCKIRESQDNVFKKTDMVNVNHSQYWEGCKSTLNLEIFYLKV